MKPKIFHKLIHILQSILAIPHQQQPNLMTHTENHIGLLPTVRNHMMLSVNNSNTILANGVFKTTFFQPLHVRSF